METLRSLARRFYGGWYPGGLLFLACGALYFKTLTFGYVSFDDSLLVLANHRFLKNIADIGALFTHNVYFMPTGAFYRPLLTLSFMLNAQLGGTAPFGYHLANIALHGAGTCLFYYFLRLLDFRKPAALFLALFFAVNPALVQAVAWVPGRNDSLLGILVLASFISCARYYAAPTVVRCLVHLLSFAAALLVKENAAAIVLVCALYPALWLRKGPALRTLLPLAAGWTVILAGWTAVRLFCVSGLHAAAFVQPPNLRMIGDLLLGPVQYAGKSFVPLSQTLYPLLSATGVLAGAAVLVFIVAGMRIAVREGRDRIFFGLAWFLAFLLPTLIAKNNYLFDHRMYVPLMGLLAAAAEAGGSMPAVKTAGRGLRIGAAAAAILLFAVQSYRYSDSFAGSIVYWQRVVRESPGESEARLRLAEAYRDKGRLMAAVAELDRALSLNPSNGAACFMRAEIFAAAGYNDAAEADYRRGLQVRPRSVVARTLLGRLYEKRGMPEEAVEEFKKALAVSPGKTALYEDLARGYLQAGETGKAGFYARRFVASVDAAVRAGFERRNPALARLAAEYHE